MGVPGSADHLRAIGQQPGEVGRASKFDPQAGFGQKIRDLAQAGEFPEVWAAECGVTKQTLKNWAQAHPDFREDLVIAVALLEAFWSRLPLKHLTNKNLRSPTLLHTLATRFPKTWAKGGQDMRDELGLTGREEVALTPEQIARATPQAELEARVAELMRRQRVRDAATGER